MRKYQIRICTLLFLFMIILAGETCADEAFGFLFPQSSYAYLSYEQVADLSPQILCYAKNEIFARNGRTFVSEELQNYFQQQYWYSACYSPEQFSSDMLNAIEQANVDLLAEVESEKGGYTLDAPGYTYDPVYFYQAASDQAWNVYDVDPDSFVFFDSDARYLSQSELAELTLQELCYARNEIYARHGWIFHSVELSDYFNQKNWYWGIYDEESFNVGLLNVYEATNCQTLKEMEFSLSPSGYLLDQPGYNYSSIRSFRNVNQNSLNASDYIFWDSNIRYLTMEDLEGLSLQQVNYARNEIYARRGYIFQSQELRDYFGSRSWYQGTLSSNIFSSDVFNDVELTNIELLKSYEYSLSPDGYLLY